MKTTMEAAINSAIEKSNKNAFNAICWIYDIDEREPENITHLDFDFKNLLLFVETEEGEEIVIDLENKRSKSSKYTSEGWRSCAYEEEPNFGQFEIEYWLHEGNRQEDPEGYAAFLSERK